MAASNDFIARTTAARPALARVLRRMAWMLLAALGAALPATALGANACSSMIGRVTLNEYNYIDNFTEIKNLDASTNMTGWKVTVYTSNRATSGVLPATGANSCSGGLYQVNQFASNEVSQNADIVLFDSNNDVVDVLRVRTSSADFSTSFYPAGVPACGYLSSPYNLLVSSANKGVDRSPDGVGTWRNTPGAGAGSYSTRCGGNTPGGTTTDLGITKTASSGSVLLGAGVTFTVKVSNLGPATGSALVINDMLPAGLAYVSHTVTAGTYTPSTGLWSLSTLAVGASQTLTLTANGASAGTWTNTATVASDNPETNTANNTASATVTVASPAPASFNAFETGTVAGATTGVIKTKIAGVPFSLDVVAISGGTQLGTFNNAVRVELLGNSTTGISLDANRCPVSATLLQTVAPNPTVSGGRSTVGFAAVSNAWKDVRVRISYPAAAPTEVACSGDNFAIRPASMGTVTVSDADSVTAGTARTLSNAAASGGNVHKAGRPFYMGATALNAVGAATTNYAESPAASLTACVLPGSGCVLGVLATGGWSAASGTVTTSGASYSEAGAFAMKLVDSTFAEVDAADSSLAERAFESPVVNVGRFVPDHFTLATASVPRFKTFNDTSCATRSFTYIGQPFGYLTLPQATITARNAAGATTLNYAGALWKLAPGGVTQTYTSATGVLDTGLIGAPSVAAIGAGTGKVTANAADVVSFFRTTPVAPFMASISLSMSVRDTSENAVSGNGSIDTGTPALFSGIAFDSGNEIRFGQLALSNAHGSELLGLPVPLEAQYWTGSAFTRNAADSCTQLAASHVALANWQRDLNACETSVSLSGRFSAGRGSLRLSAPGAGNTGSVDLTLNLGVTGGGSTCVASAPAPVTGASMTWLRGRWTGGAYDQYPAARASFGLFRGGRSLIYLREMY